MRGGCLNSAPGDDSATLHPSPLLAFSGEQRSPAPERGRCAEQRGSGAEQRGSSADLARIRGRSRSSVAAPGEAPRTLPAPGGASRGEDVYPEMQNGLLKNKPCANSLIFRFDAYLCLPNFIGEALIGAWVIVPK